MMETGIKHQTADQNLGNFLWLIVPPWLFDARLDLALQTVASLAPWVGLCADLKCSRRHFIFYWKFPFPLIGVPFEWDKWPPPSQTKFQARNVFMRGWNVPFPSFVLLCRLLSGRWVSCWFWILHRKIASCSQSRPVKDVSGSCIASSPFCKCHRYFYICFSSSNASYDDRTHHAVNIFFVLEKDK